MTTVVGICNLALSHLGDDAEVHNIDPPDGSAQSYHCARWYLQALYELLEMHPWTFARGRRQNLGGFDTDSNQWPYMYAMPTGIIKPYRALPPGYSNEDEDGIKFEVQGSVIYAESEIDTLLVILPVTDTSKFSPLFVAALAMLLASKLLGPIRKTIGGSELEKLMQLFARQFAIATGSNANIDNNDLEHTAPWIKNR